MASSGHVAFYPAFAQIVERGEKGQVEGAVKNDFLGKEWSKSSSEASANHDKSPQIERSHQYLLYLPRHTSLLLLKKRKKTNVFLVLQKLTHI